MAFPQTHRCFSQRSLTSLERAGTDLSSEMVLSHWVMKALYEIKDLWP